jgi:hypothetical protein
MTLIVNAAVATEAFQRMSLQTEPINVVIMMVIVMVIQN